MTEENKFDNDNSNPNQSSGSQGDNYSNNSYKDTTYHYSYRNGDNGDFNGAQGGQSSQGNPYNTYNPNAAPNNSGNQNPNSGNGSYNWNFTDYQAASREKKPRKNSGVLVFCSILACVALVGVVTLSGIGIYSLVKNNVNTSNNSESEMSSEPPIMNDSIEIKDRPSDMSGVPVYTPDGLDTVEIAKKVTPCVVGITQYADYNTFNPSGYGSGILISSDGYIVTNAHVVSNAIALNVETSSGETYSAKIIGIDSRSDLAVIKIEGENLPVAEFGNSDELQVGEKVIAIGNPGSSILAGSVTQGIVSGINRTIKDGGYAVNYIQVDAAINPGNSGGALVNSFGQVVGINSAKIAAVDYEGIGFSIPIKDAKPIVDDLKANGYVSGRTKIGINGKVVPQILADINNFPTGVMIINIETTSDLANTKVTQGDIITHINGVRIENFDQISEQLVGKKAGETIKISLFRPTGKSSGQSFDVTCKLMPDVEKQQAVIQ